MPVIGLSDQEAAALTARAAAEGPTLEAWLKKFGEESSTAPRSPQEAVARILECRSV